MTLRSRAEAVFSNAEVGFAEQDQEVRLEFEKELIKQQFAAELESIREHLDITAKHLAARSGLKPPNMSRILSGENNTTLESLAAVAFSLGTRLTPHLEPIIRKGTPAEHDPALPGWVCQLVADEDANADCGDSPTQLRRVTFTPRATLARSFNFQVSEENARCA